jgi:PAS domain S-box-containing protein
MNKTSSPKSRAPKYRYNLQTAELEALLDAIPASALLLDISKKCILLGNARAAELTSYTRVELSGMPLHSLFSPTNEGSIPLFIKAHAGQECELELVKRSGGKISVKALPTHLNPNSNLHLLSLELTSQRQIRQFEQECQDKVWEVWPILSNAYLKADMDEVMALILEAGQELTGGTCMCIYQVDSRQPILQRTAHLGPMGQLPEQISPQDLTHLLQSPVWVAGKRPSCLLYRLARASNFTYLASTPLGQPNAVIGLLLAAGEQPPPLHLKEILQGLAIQITALIQIHTSTAQLRQNLAQHAVQGKISTVIQTASKDGIILLSPDLRIQSVNPFSKLSLGYTSREMIGQPIENILIGTDSLSTAWQTVRQGSPRELLDNIELYRRNGERFPAQVNLLPVNLENKLQGIVIIFRDLSEQEQYRSRNLQLEQRALLGEVTASFAHEVRNPINNISTGLQLLAINLPPSDPNQENICRLQNDCERLAELVKSSLSFIRPMEYKLEAIDLPGLIDHLLERWHARLARANIKYHTQFDENLPAVEGDARSLEQVFTNLVNNAIQAIEPKGGVISIKAKRVLDTEGHPQVEISVSDTGPGIPPEIRDRIFEPFFTTKQSGTGLGLAIVKRIITAHKGAIHVDSVPGGTIFQIYLPVAE